MPARPQYQCRECAALHAKWSGQCSDCKGWNCIEEIPTQPTTGGTRSNWHGKGKSEVLTLEQVPTSATPRFSTQLGELDRVTYLDIRGEFLLPDGSLNPETMAGDGVHITTKGYEAWANAIEPTVRNLLGEL